MKKEEKQPVVEFKSTNNKKIIFIGMCHVGNEEYYKYVQDIIDKNSNNSLVLYEGTREMSNVEYNVLNKYELRIRSFLYNLLNFSDMISDITYNSSQGDLIDVNDNFIYADVSEYYMIKKLAHKNFRVNKLNRYISDILKVLDVIYKNKNKRGLDVRSCLRAISSVIMFHLSIIQMSKFFSVIKRDREKNLFSYVKNNIRDYDTILIVWGANHLSGISKMIKNELDFKENKRYNLNVEINY